MGKRVSITFGDFFTWAYKRGNSYGNVAGWFGGWLALRHSQYCIKKTKPILKLFQHLVAPSIRHLGPLTPIPNSKGNPFIGGV